MGCRIRIEPGLYITASIAVLLIPLKWLLVWVLAALAHELFHIFLVWILRYRINSISIGAFGARIECEPMPRLQTVLCAVAGPIGSLLLICFSRYMPELAICGFVQGVFNLLPMYPLDGGRILRQVLIKLPQRHIDRIELLIRVFVLAMAAVVLYKLTLHILPCLILFTIFLAGRKIPLQKD